jgi:hypothetical protein
MVRIKPKIKSLVEEDLLTTKEIPKLLPKKESLEAVEEKKPTLSERVQEGIELLSSCVKPEEDEEIKVMKTEVKQGYARFSIEYPVVVRGSETKLVDVAYLADRLTRAVGGDFGLLKQCIDSNFLRKNILQRARVVCDATADYFFEKCFESLDSRDSLALYLGYSLLLPDKIERVEETGKYDEKGRKVFNVHSLDFRGIDPKIYGAGVSICKYLGLKVKINSCYG